MNIINLRFELKNPFDRWEFFRSLGCVHGRLGQHSAWEIQHSYYSPLLVDCELRWSRCTDHAGIEFSIGVLGYGVQFRTYDTRHWNYDKNRWEEWNWDEYSENNS
jgi:hypothetical protein